MTFDPNNLATINGSATREVVIGGRTYRVSPLRLCDLADLNAFLMRKIPRPKEEAKRHIRDLKDALPQEVLVRIWDEACEAEKDYPPSMGSPQGQAALLTSEGMAEVVWIFLRHTIAGFTREQAAVMTTDMTADEFQAIQDAAAPPRPPEDDGDPKATVGQVQPGLAS